MTRSKKTGPVYQLKIALAEILVWVNGRRGTVEGVIVKLVTE